MNILFISPFDLVTERLWGPTIRLHSLAKEINKRGHNTILAGPPPCPGEKPKIVDTVRMYYFKRYFHRYDYPNDDHGQERQKHNLRRYLPMVIFSRAREIYSLINKHAVDIIFVNRAFPDTAYAAYGANLLQKKIMVCDWDDLEGLHGFSSSFRNPLYRQLIETINEVVFPRLADLTIVASHHLKEFAADIGVTDERLFHAPTVGDSDIFRPGISAEAIKNKFHLHGHKVLFYCGNLMKGNGVKTENIIHTLKGVLDQDTSFKMLVVGDGDLIQPHDNGEPGELIRLATELGIRQQVVFTGSVPYQQMPTYLAAADMCLALFPVNLITMTKSPLKLYEYMCAGKPVLARDVGEISRCISDWHNGLLVYSDSPKEYSTKIIKAFEDKNHLIKIGYNARKTIDNRFSWKHSADIVIKACEHMLTQKRNT